MTFELKPLPYDHDALEPYIDAETLKVHHGKHHQTYVDKLNGVLKDHPELLSKTVEELVTIWPTLPDKIKTGVRNHAGGVANHDFMWAVLKKDVKPHGEILSAIEHRWGSFDAFKSEFSTMALAVFGSGWTWLVVKGDKLELVNTPNQDSPLTEGIKPIFVIDVWEHAYYLKYRNRRAEYIENYFNIINWDKVGELYGHIKKH